MSIQDVESRIQRIESRMQALQTRFRSLNARFEPQTASTVPQGDGKPANFEQLLQERMPENLPPPFDAGEPILIPPRAKPTPVAPRPPLVPFTQILPAREESRTTERRQLRPAELRPLIETAARRHRLDPELIQAVMGVESDFRPEAVSSRGARGLMQLMPETAAEMGVSDPFDPAENIEGGARYLRKMLDRYGDVETALAAYNAGPGTVDRYGKIPPWRETLSYVRDVLRAYAKERDGTPNSDE